MWPRNTLNSRRLTCNEVETDYLIVDSDSANAFVVRHNNVGSDVFTVDTLNGTITVTGDLKVYGNTVFSDTQNYETTDNLIQLANGNDGDTRDIGIYGVYHDGSDHYAAMYREAKSARWKICTTDVLPNLTVGTSTLADFECKYLYGELKTASQPNITALAGLLSVAPSYNGYLYATSGVLSASSSIPYSSISGISATAPITYSGGVIGFDYSLQTNLKFNNAYAYFKTSDTSHHFIRYDATLDGLLFEGFGALGFNINGFTRIQIVDAGIYMPYQTADRYMYLNSSNILVSRAASDWTSDVRSAFSAGSGIGIASGVISVNSLSAFSSDDLKEGSTNMYYTTARWDTRLATKTTDNLTEGSSNLYYTTARWDSRLATKTTDNLTEGSTNQYYTTARWDTRLATKSTDDLKEGLSNLYYTDARFDTRMATKTTDNLTEGSNLYYTTARWDTRLATKTTDNLTEGSTYLYYTNARARGALSVSAPLTYNSSTGAFGFGYNTTNLQITSSNLNTIQNIDLTASPQFRGIYLKNNGNTNHSLIQMETNVDSYNNFLYLIRYRTGGLTAFQNIHQWVSYAENSTGGLYGAFSFYTYNNSSTAGSEVATTVFESMQSGSNVAVLGFIGSQVQFPTQTASSLLYVDGNKYLQSTVIGNGLTFSGGSLSPAQDIRTSALPTFGGLSLNGDLQMKTNYIYLRNGDTNHSINYDATADGPRIAGWSAISFVTNSGGTTERFKVTTNGPNLPLETASTYAYIDSSKNIVSRSTANFTADVRAQLSAGSGISISSGAISTSSTISSGELKGFTFADLMSGAPLDAVNSLNKAVYYTRIGNIITLGGYWSFKCSTTFSSFDFAFGGKATQWTPAEMIPASFGTTGSVDVLKGGGSGTLTDNATGAHYPVKLWPYVYDNGADTNTPAIRFTTGSFASAIQTGTGSNKGCLVHFTFTYTIA